MASNSIDESKVSDPCQASRFNRKKYSSECSDCHSGINLAKILKCRVASYWRGRALVKPVTVEDPLQEENRTDYVASSIPKKVRLSKPPLAEEYEVKKLEGKKGIFVSSKNVAEQDL